MEESQELIAAREEVAAMVERAHAAQAQIAHYNQEQVNELITAMVWARDIYKCCANLPHHA